MRSVQYFFRNLLTNALPTAFIFFIAACMSYSCGAQSQVRINSDSLRQFSVYIQRTPSQAWPGYGVYIGNGLVLTAAHVVGGYQQHKPRVVISGKSFETTLIKEGSLETTDLTLLLMNLKDLPAGFRDYSVTLCAAPSRPGQELVVVVPDRISYARVLPVAAIPESLRTKYPSLIGNVAGTGDSGSGVFDPVTNCLAGIVSQKLQRRVPTSAGSTETTVVDIAKYYVASDVISKFLED